MNAVWRLLRIDKPIGIILLFIPLAWGMALGNKSNYLLGLLGAFAMRGAGCIVNDIFDRKIDSRVQRTKHRPLASEELFPAQALIILSIPVGIGCCIFPFLPIKAQIFSVLAATASVIYPLSKRFFKAPQFILGFLCFGLTLPVGYFWAEGSNDQAALLLYFGHGFWCVFYDSIYALQDVQDDLKVGVHSLITTLGNYVNHGLFVLSSVSGLFLISAFYCLDKSIVWPCCFLFALYAQIYLLRYNNYQQLFIINGLLGLLLWLVL